MALRVGDPALARAPAHRDVLKRALAALVADGAVEGVVDQQELDDGVLRLLHAVGLRLDDHAVADRGRAGRLELRDALDLDQAHATGAHGAAELGLVTEDRDLDVAALCRVDQHRALGRRHLDAVDDERDLLAVAHPVAPRTSGGSSAPATSIGPGAAVRAASIASSNSWRNFLTIEPTGIAIASPRTHRQLPMMFSWTEEMMSRSIGVASPRTTRSSIFTVQFVPSRHGVHLPHDSWW